MSTPQGFRDRVVCPVCGYDNGGWRSECESCGALLRQDATPVRYVYPDERKSVPVWRWILFGIFLLRSCFWMARASELFSTPSYSEYTPSYINTVAPANSSSFYSPLSPLAMSSVGADPFQYGSDILVSDGLTLNYPMLWQAYLDGPDSVQMEGSKEFLNISWEKNEENTNTDFLAMKASAPEIFDAFIQQKLEETVSSGVQAGGGQMSELVLHEKAHVGHLELLYGSYETSIYLDGSFLQLAHFAAACPEERICFFIYGRVSASPLDADDWHLLDQIADSLQFASTTPAPDDDLPTQPLSPLPALLTPEVEKIT